MQRPFEIGDQPFEETNIILSLAEPGVAVEAEQPSNEARVVIVVDLKFPLFSADRASAAL